jgi:hypothetical protein
MEMTHEESSGNIFADLGLPNSEQAAHMVAVRWPATIEVHVVLPHPGTFPNGPGIASSEGSRGRVTYSRQRLPC